MHSSSQNEISVRCQTCFLNKLGFFCNLDPVAAKDLEMIKHPSYYSSGAVLFLEKQSNRGIYVLCSGKVKLSISSSGGKTLTLRIAKPGEILGLTAAISGLANESSAETLEPCHVELVRSVDFTHFIQKHPEAYQAMVRQLTSQYSDSCEQMRTICLAASSREKLARLLLHWSSEGRERSDGMRLQVPLTHEQIAECVGSTRETITRTLSDFKAHHLVTLKGATITIPNIAALQAVAGA